VSSTTGPRRPNPDTQRDVLSVLINGYQTTALLHVAARLGLADLLADGPRSSSELAQSLGAHGPSLRRILRGLVAIGVFSEGRDGRFGLTPRGQWLRAETPGSLRGTAILAAEEYVGAWGGLLHSAMTGEPAFDHVFGMSLWQHREQHPELDAYFNATLSNVTSRVADVLLAAYDFSAFHTVLDVGGGQGALLAAILKAHPSLTGILYDKPHVIAQARSHLEEAGVAARCQAVEGDFFDHVPEGADAHILKHVIHDWDDERSIAILRNCHSALKEQGRLLIVERLLPPRAEEGSIAMLRDVVMLATTSGRERSEAEFRDIVAAAGFTLARVIPTRFPIVIIECTRGEVGKEGT